MRELTDRRFQVLERVQALQVGSWLFETVHNQHKMNLVHLIVHPDPS